MQPSSKGGWHGYRISLKIASPIHCGWRTTGNLKQTRPYVPGSAIWGSLAARLGRDRYQGNYDEAEKFVNRSLRFTYLYPSLQQDRVTHWPWGVSAGEFDWLYLNSYVSTALVDGRAKDDGMLHETEYVSPRARDGRQTYLTGYFWERGEWDWETWTRAQFGGERTYGWGRVGEVEREALGAGDRIYGTWKVDAEGEEVVVRPAASSGSLFLPAHIVGATDEQEALFQAGIAEPWLGRRIHQSAAAAKVDGKGQMPVPGELRRSTGGFGLSAARAAWAPGSRFRSGCDQKFQVGEKGCWIL